jgi:hypothetical protein
MSDHDETRRRAAATRIGKMARSALCAVPLMCLGVAGCGPSGGEHGHGLLGMRHGGLSLVNKAAHLGMRGMRPHGGFRRACAEDVERLCPKIDSRREQRECLEGKRESLSAECRTALDAHHRGRGGEQNQSKP